MSTVEPSDRQSLVRLLDDQAAGLAMQNVESDARMGPPISALRRRRRRASESEVGVLSLVQSDGVLRWDLGGGARSAAGRRGRRGGGAAGDTIAQYRFEALPPNQIGTYLEKADLKLTPTRGLHTLTPSGAWYAWTPVAAPPRKGRVLVFIHGTFSTSENYLSELVATPEGRKFMKRAADRYDAVLAFGHPTLSVSPIVNALDLAALFDGSAAEIDVIAHSRGGLVARWWLDALARGMTGKHRAVLVGTPVGGTSLASPASIRSAMDLLTNVGDRLRKLASVAGAVAPPVAPFLQLPMVLLQVTTSVTGVLAKTPIADAAVAMVPGLNGQSRVGNSPELRRLRALRASPVAYSVVRSNFEPSDPGWKFWEYFRDIKGRAADLGADVVFPGANDLVVDTDSMTDFRDAPAFSGLEHDFGTSSTVLHTNYFRQPETLDLIATAFAWK